jgi:hydroxypyruvate isomerase
MAGLVGQIAKVEARRTYYSNLEKAVRLAEGTGVQLLIEPLNLRDRPGYFLFSSDQAGDIIEHTGLSQLRLMFDCYHIQVQEGDLITRLRRHFDKIGHIQIAGVPSRGEPNRGEVNYSEVLREIDQLHWKGWIGAEYKPAHLTTDGLEWLAPLRSEGLLS